MAAKALAGSPTKPKGPRQKPVSAEEQAERSLVDNCKNLRDYEMFVECVDDRTLFVRLREECVARAALPFALQAKQRVLDSPGRLRFGRAYDRNLKSLYASDDS
eukprot:2709693-Alexandrium_andersonii.AAC.1